MTTFIMIIFIILAIITVFSFIRVLNNISSLLREKTNLTHMQSKKSINDQIDSTNDLLDLIIYLINTEINIVLRSYISLGQRYELIHLDDDIKRISNEVYSGITSSAFTDSNLLIKTDYILKFINQQTTLLLLASVKAYNDQIRSNAQ